MRAKPVRTLRSLISLSMAALVAMAPVAAVRAESPPPPKRPNIVMIVVDDAALMERISKRYADQGRPDDNPDSFKVRLDAYNRNTAPLLPYYSERGLLTEVDGMGSIESVAAAIDAALDGTGT